ncbi:hypothetical protein [Fulvimarina sp. MAC3]|uniref:hypothetical protein n=1 Tax=Fulvimarina sp. MAC3 TaxID=3148887 RepID=UPI0031FCA1E6
MFNRDLPRMEDEAVILHAIEELMRQGLDRRMIEKALVQYAPIDLDIFADCFAKAMASVKRSARSETEAIAA